MFPEAPSEFRDEWGEYEYHTAVAYSRVHFCTYCGLEKLKKCERKGRNPLNSMCGQRKATRVYWWYTLAAMAIAITTLVLSLLTSAKVGVWGL
jgi:hypothetical protein